MFMIPCYVTKRNDRVSVWSAAQLWRFWTIHILLFVAMVITTRLNLSAETQPDTTVYAAQWRVAANILFWCHAQFGTGVEIQRDFRGTSAPLRNLGASAGIGLYGFGPEVISIDAYACVGWDFCAKIGFSTRYAYKLQTELEKQQFIDWPDALCYLAPFLDLMYCPYDNGVQVGLGCEYVFDLNYDFHMFMPRLTLGYIF